MGVDEGNLQVMDIQVLMENCSITIFLRYILESNNYQNAPRPSEHPPVRGEKMSKRLGGIKGCKY